MRDFARLTLCYDQIFAGHGSPGDIGRTRTSPAIDAMTIGPCHWPTLQHVSCPAANASTSELHIIRLAHSNHECTRMNTNLGSACVSRAGCGVSPQRTSQVKRIRKPGSQDAVATPLCGVSALAVIANQALHYLAFVSLIFPRRISTPVITNPSMLRPK